MHCQMSSISCPSSSQENIDQEFGRLQLSQSQKDMCHHISNLIQQQVPVFVVMTAPATTISLEEIKGQRYRHKILTYNRKEKSLEELSRKFIDAYEGKDSNMLALDQVTVRFNVERRRVYDVINILESLKVVNKQGKNQYKWEGLKQALKTIRNCQIQNHCTNAMKSSARSLEALASEFLFLFLHYKPAITLEEAARHLLKDELVNPQIIKTKIRRLYDIVNVFKALGLVRRGAIVTKTKKNGFIWVGVHDMQEIISTKSREKQEVDMQNSNSQQRSTDAIKLPKFMLSPPTYDLNEYGSRSQQCCQLVKRQVLVPRLIYRPNSAFSYFSGPA